MKRSNYHTHTLFCDGSDSAEELVLEAIRLGCPEIGFSGHSCLEIDTGSMTADGMEKYCSEIQRLKARYAEKIKILLGIEQDYFSELPHKESFDFIIGAVHYVEKGGNLCPVDETREQFLKTVDDLYHGDFYSFAEDYYATVADLYRKTQCNVIAHFDLITKYNEGNALFDTMNPRYIKAADTALDSLLESPAILEINTGAQARGYRKTPYPEQRILKRWLDAGRTVILSSDCHDKKMLLFGLEEAAEELPRPELLLQRMPVFETESRC
ncbi:MAG: histidinol-phosphatase [Oscillospiraceae bacterium]|nr:histidinol-phosphatase [Oscillospiraceae bacterium]